MEDIANDTGVSKNLIIDYLKKYIVLKESPRTNFIKKFLMFLFFLIIILIIIFLSVFIARKVGIKIYEAIVSVLLLLALVMPIGRLIILPFFAISLMWIERSDKNYKAKLKREINQLVKADLMQSDPKGAVSIAKDTDLPGGELSPSDDKKGGLSKKGK